jgi:NAD(P)-dependent dehydrogenase (short-subunit alcohol dehydrogenase family)
LPITSVVSAHRQIRFADDDMARFSDASWDRNPLHLSADYARRTPYGERVVFGALGLLRALEHSASRQTQLSRISADFQSPLFLGVAYDVHIAEDSPTRLRASVHDGRDLVMSFTAEFSDGPAPLLTPAAPTAPPRNSAAQHTTSSIVGASASGSYYPRESLDLSRHGLSQQHVAALTWCSYLIGMELPGERALFSRLVLSFAATSATGPLAYQATVKNFDDRFNLARIGATLWIGGAIFAEGELRAFVREDVPRGSAAELSGLLPPSDALRGKVALVTGGSRGLGAAIVRALASQGCTVLVNFLKGRDEFNLLAREVHGLRPAQGDAADPAWSSSIRDQIVAHYGALDILVCNAALPLRGMALHHGAAERLADYVARSVALASTPMATLLDSVAERNGWNVVISSAAVEEPPSDWPHYVSAKAAIEALARVAALQYPSISTLVVRPPRLLTDLTNTPSPLSRQDVLSPDIIAARIVRRLLRDPAPGLVDLLNQNSTSQEQ